MPGSFGLAAEHDRVGASQRWQSGKFEVRWHRHGFEIGQHRAGVYRPLLAPPPNQPLIAASKAHLLHRENRGSFSIKFGPEPFSEQIEILKAIPRNHSLSLSGRLVGQGQQASFRLELQMRDSQQLGMSLKVDGAASLRLQLKLDPQAYYRGLGAQPSRLELRGGRYEMLAQEAGIGRGAQPLSSLVNLVSPGSAGHAGTSYYPQPVFW
ncbi:MAG: hypothetical protein CVV27_03520, partial [Candidatus Melainabacteria bacterium HGW-Melainabacteria-1]